MTLEDYLSLPTEAQWDELWEHGQHLENNSCINVKFSLYALDKFFVEIELCVETEKILGLYPFRHGFRLNKYVGQIPLH